MKEQTVPVPFLAFLVPVPFLVFSCSFLVSFLAVFPVPMFLLQQSVTCRTGIRLDLNWSNSVGPVNLVLMVV
jgi:hypothetical protein